MNKGWRQTGNTPSAPCRWGKNFPNKGYGIVGEYFRAGYWWEVWLSTYRDEVSGRYIRWDGGETNTMEEAKKIVDDTFELIEPLGVEE